MINLLLDIRAFKGFDAVAAVALPSKTAPVNIVTPVAAVTLLGNL